MFEAPVSRELDKESSAMRFEVRLADMGDESFEKGEVSQWMVAVGDTVRADQDLLEMTTDKAAFTVPSPKAGKVAEICIFEHQEAAIGDLLCVLEV